MHRNESPHGLGKVPEVVLGFWVIKILATTLGEIGGDAVSMSMNLGYLVSTLYFAALFALFVFAQIRVRRFNPWLYWGTIIASTTVGTTLADFTDRSLGVGYQGGSTILLSLLVGSLLLWHRATGTISVASVGDGKSETFYWLTITFSQTLGTALGDWVADTQGMGYTGGMLIFGGLLGGVTALYFLTRVNRTALFWAAFVLTRPLGAVVGDFLDKPAADGGLALSRYGGSMALLAAILLLILVLPQRPARSTH